MLLLLEICVRWFWLCKVLMICSLSLSAEYQHGQQYLMLRSLQESMSCLPLSKVRKHRTSSNYQRAHRLPHLSSKAQFEDNLSLLLQMVCKIELLIEFQNNLKHENYSDSKIDVMDAGCFCSAAAPILKVCLVSFVTYVCFHGDRALSKRT